MAHKELNVISQSRFSHKFQNLKTTQCDKWGKEKSFITMNLFIF